MKEIKNPGKIKNAIKKKLDRQGYTVLFKTQLETKVGEDDYKPIAIPFRKPHNGNVCSGITECIIARRNEQGTISGHWGFAYRSDEDDYDKTMGHTVALRRAYRRLKCRGCMGDYDEPKNILNDTSKLKFIIHTEIEDAVEAYEEAKEKERKECEARERQEKSK